MYRVLIAEDEDIIRKGIAYTMDWVSMGCTIIGEAADGREGIEKIAELKPDIVLADIMMPGVDGLEMLKQSMAENEFKAIIMTSYADFAYAKKAIELGVSAYLMKPIDETELKQNVEKIIEEIEKEKKVEKLMEKTKSGEEPEVIYVKQDVDNDYVQQILDATKQRYGEKISMEGFAEEFGVSSSYLSRKFKEATGFTYLDFLNKYRVQKAIKLLEKGTYKVYEVSDMTGFSDYKHFNAVFKRYTGQAPSEFVN